MSSKYKLTSLRAGCPGIRYIIMVISILVLTFAGANTVVFNFTVICMFKSNINTTLNPTLLYNSTEQSWLFSATAIGSLIGLVPMMLFAHKWDTRWIFTVYGIISGISMLLMPLGVSTAFGIVFVLRMMQGFGNCAAFFALGSIVNTWSPLKSVGMYVTMLSTNVQLGPGFAFAVSGALCSSPLGWPAVYYLHGGLTILFFTIFMLMYRDDVSSHPFITENEVKIILKDKPLTSLQHPKTPFKEIFTDVVVWGIFASTFAVAIGLIFLMTYGPIYIKNVFQFDVKKTTFVVVLPFVLALTTKLFIGPLSDCVTCISEKTKIIMFNTIAQLPICICFILMATLPNDPIWLIQIVYSSISVFSSFNTIGVFKCIQLVAQQHAGVIFGVVCLINSIVSLFLPLLVRLLVPDYTAQQWTTILYIFSGTIALMLVVFNVVCQAEPRKWTMKERKPLSSPR